VVAIGCQVAVDERCACLSARPARREREAKLELVGVGIRAQEVRRHEAYDARPQPRVNQDETVSGGGLALERPTESGGEGRYVHECRSALEHDPLGREPLVGRGVHH
jgi:hypothetical protein